MSYPLNERQLLVADLGFEPSRSSPSSQSPEFISLRRTPVLSALGCCMGLEPILTESQSVVLTFTLTAPLTIGYSQALVPISRTASRESSRLDHWNNITSTADITYCLSAYVRTSIVFVWI